MEQQPRLYAAASTDDSNVDGYNKIRYMACAIPAARAVRIDPTMAMRTE
jgi:hypothetical protein